MSGKNRAFALAVTTAALVGLSAPVASAATTQNNPSGFNNDSLVNVSGNQLPLQACNNQLPVNVGGIQVPLSNLAGALGLASSGTSATVNNTCVQGNYQKISSATITGNNKHQDAWGDPPGPNGGPSHPNSGPPSHPNNGPSNTSDRPSNMPNDPQNISHDPAMGSHDPAGDPSTSGFNNDSLLNLSNNQVPVQACNNYLPLNFLGAQVPVSGLAGALGILSTGTTASQANTCVGNSVQKNSSYLHS
jgi:hypothetical protein